MGSCFLNNKPVFRYEHLVAENKSKANIAYRKHASCWFGGSEQCLTAARVMGKKQGRTERSIPF